MATAKRSTPRSTSHSTKRAATTSGRTTRTATRSTAAKAHKTTHGPAAKAKKSPDRQTSRCWPGFEPVPGKSSGEKGSCKPKARQTSSEKKSDAKAAAATKLHKSGK